MATRLEDLETRAVRLIEQIARRGRGEGAGWFSPVTWEFTELDAKELATVASVIQKELTRLASRGEK